MGILQTGTSKKVLRIIEDAIQEVLQFLEQQVELILYFMLLTTIQIMNAAQILWDLRQHQILAFYKPNHVLVQVTIQHPALFPRGRKHFITIPLDQIVLGSVKPIMMKTSKKLRTYSPTKRQCYFIAEKSLKFFRTYNQPNCLLECLANATFDSCGCVGLYMPRTYQHN